MEFFKELILEILRMRKLDLFQEHPCKNNRFFKNTFQGDQYKIELFESTIVGTENKVYQSRFFYRPHILAPPDFLYFDYINNRYFSY